MCNEIVIWRSGKGVAPYFRKYFAE